MNSQQMEQEIIRLADIWTAAELRGDITFIEKTLTQETWQLASLHYCNIGQPPTFMQSPQP